MKILFFLLFLGVLYAFQIQSDPIEFPKDCNIEELKFGKICNQFLHEEDTVRDYIWIMAYSFEPKNSLAASFADYKTWVSQDLVWIKKVLLLGSDKENGLLRLFVDLKIFAGLINVKSQLEFKLVGDGGIENINRMEYRQIQKSDPTYMKKCEDINGQVYSCENTNVKDQYGIAEFIEYDGGGLMDFKLWVEPGFEGGNFTVLLRRKEMKAKYTSFIKFIVDRAINYKDGISLDDL